MPPKRLTPRGEAAPPVEPIVTGATMPPKPSVKRRAKPKKTESGAAYVRNLHHIKATVRLTTGREIALEPRGQREDLDIVNADEQEDSKFLANLGLLFELVSLEDAKAIIAKQQTNARKRPSTLFDNLRNAKGEAYEGHVQIQEAFERQGVVVGRVSTPSEDGSSSSLNVGNYDRVGPEVVQVPGSPEHPATRLAESIPGYVDPEEYHEFLLWKQFKEARAREEG